MRSSGEPGAGTVKRIGCVAAEPRPAWRKPPRRLLAASGRRAPWPMPGPVAAACDRHGADAARGLPLECASVAPVAQPDRVVASEAIGRGFESLRAHHIIPSLHGLFDRETCRWWTPPSALRRATACGVYRRCPYYPGCRAGPLCVERPARPARAASSCSVHGIPSAAGLHRLRRCGDRRSWAGDAAAAPCDAALDCLGLHRQRVRRAHHNALHCAGAAAGPRVAAVAALAEPQCGATPWHPLRCRVSEVAMNGVAGVPLRRLAGGRR